MKMVKSYSELIKLPTFEERFRYLKCTPEETENEKLGRSFLQTFYGSIEWKQVRRMVVVRDNGLDLGCKGHEIAYHPIIHHINPISLEDLVNRTELLLDPENLICTCKRTHEAIHHGNESILYTPELVVRRPGDTTLW